MRKSPLKSSLPWISMLALGAAFVGCAKEEADPRAGIAPEPEKRADSLIENSFGAEAKVDLPDLGNLPDLLGKKKDTLGVKVEGKGDRAKVALEKSALEKEFLLQVSMIPQEVVATSSGMKSRVVTFRRRGDSVYMLEALPGHTITTDLPQTLILAEFPILKESAKRLVIDFNAGVSKIFLAGDWYDSDWDGQEYDGWNQLINVLSANTEHSYLESVEINKTNQLYVRQIAKLNLGSSLKYGYSFEARYYLSPYQPDPTFEPTVSKNHDRYGFFEVMPVLKSDGNSVVRASKWNLRKGPIEYAVSANTPAEYKQAVKDGILVWNAIFGEEIVKAVDAPEGVTAPDPSRNVVQWVPWDTAGFAYADAQMDPRSGEILHAQVYFTSVFALSGKARARLGYKRMTMNRADVIEKSDHADTGDADAKAAAAIRRAAARGKLAFGLKGFQPQKLCHLDYSRAFSGPAPLGLNMDELAGADEAKILKVSQDYVREVVAHEIGHTLGLRHNFAGSLAMNVPLREKAPQVSSISDLPANTGAVSEPHPSLGGTAGFPKSRAETYERYLKEGKTPSGVITSSSVMEYQLFEEGAMTGDQIARRDVALEYDRKAMATLYRGTVYSREESPAFCTDIPMWMGKFRDCRPFDTGASVIEYADFSYRESLRLLGRQFVDGMIYAKDPIYGEDKVELDEIPFNPELFASSINSTRASLYKQLLTGAKFLAVRKNFPIQNRSDVFNDFGIWMNGVDEDEISVKERAYVETEVEKLGGVAEVLFAIPSDLAEKATEKAGELLESPYSATGPMGNPVSFSPSEKDYVRRTAKKYLARVESALVKFELNTLANHAVPATWYDVLQQDEPLYFGEAAKYKIPDSKLGEELYRAHVERQGRILYAQSGDPALIEIEVMVPAPAPSVTPASEASGTPVAEVTPASESSPAATAGAEVAAATAAMVAKRVQLKLARFEYPIETRVVAAGLLSGITSWTEAAEFGITERKAATDQWQAFWLESLGGEQTATVMADPVKLPKAVYRWVNENQRIAP